MNYNEFMEVAREEVVAFAQSEQEKPSVKMVATVNAFFRAIDPTEGQKSTESAVGWRTIAAQRLAIGLIRDLSSDQLEKAQNSRNEIAGTFATVRRVGGEWRAYVARDGQTVEKVIDDRLAKDFKQGRLSIGEFIDKFLPKGITCQEDSHDEEQCKRWRR